MKDKTIIFGIFYDIFAGLSIPSSPPRPVQRQKTSHLVLAVRPHPLHYIIRTIKCFTAETDRVTSRPGYEDTRSFHSARRRLLLEPSPY